MKLSDQIKPISYLKAHAAEIVAHTWGPAGTLDYHPERRSQGGCAGYRQLRADAGDRFVAQDPRTG